MKKIVNELFLFPLLIFSLTSRQRISKQAPTELVSVEPSDKVLRMSLMTDSEDIHILLKNRSDQSIDFTDDYGVEILAYDEKWSNGLRSGTV
jgi:hypothetical protein